MGNGGQPNLFFKQIKVADEQAAAVEGEQFFIAQIVERCGHRLAAGGGQIGDFLVRDETSHDPFVTDALAFFAGQVEQKFDDAAARIAEDERHEPPLHFEFSASENFHEKLPEVAAFNHQPAQFGQRDDAAFGRLHRQRIIGAERFAEEGHFAKNLPFLEDNFCDFFAFLVLCGDFDAAFGDEKDAVGQLFFNINRLAFFEFHLQMVTHKLGIGLFDGAEDGGYIDIFEKPEIVFFHAGNK